jgi:hypothetical protein
MLGVPSEEVVRNASERAMRYGYGEWLALLQVGTQLSAWQPPGCPEWIHMLDWACTFSCPQQNVSWLLN